ncbi:MAG: hypothetical protein H6702_20050 [Myxococcales bacterium]|nr:hypothetical protein [Myxococcales bacterium]
MSDAPEGPAAPLSVPPLSAAIQRGAERLARPVTRLAHVGEPRMPLPEPPTVHSVVRDLSGVDPDPDGMTRIRIGDTPAEMARPDAIEAQLGRVTPQFTLRNTHRLSRAADPEHLEKEWALLRDESWREGLELARRGGDRVTVDPQAHSGRLAFEQQVAERRRLVVESRWHERFGRPDPPEPGSD